MSVVRTGGVPSPTLVTVLQLVLVVASASNTRMPFDPANQKELSTTS